MVRATTVLVGLVGCLVVVLLAGIGIFGVVVTDTLHPGGAEHEPPPDGSDIDATVVERQVVERINEDRREHGVGPLERHEEIRAAARAHSQDMHDRNYNAHVNPDGEDWNDRLAHIEECQDGGGENYAYMDIASRVYTSSPNTYDTRTTDGLTYAFVDWWRHSEPHRENQLDPQWEYVGVGVVVEGDHAKVTMNLC